MGWSKMIEIADTVVGWTGVAFGVCIGIPQLVKILRGGGTKDISKLTYTLLLCAVSCYLFHALVIMDPIFITAQAANLCVNSTVLILLIKGR
jgi:uncharacterized protein with PQ loop repeat